MILTIKNIQKQTVKCSRLKRGNEAGMHLNCCAVSRERKKGHSQELTSIVTQPFVVLHVFVVLIFSQLFRSPNSNLLSIQGKYMETETSYFCNFFGRGRGGGIIRREVGVCPALHYTFILYTYIHALCGIFVDLCILAL